MRKLAVSMAAILVLAVVSPAFAQPFADVPTDHWAFDAIAELAAKGIIEGFPDGTFKGDRGVTRYEVAMIVARILARIEAIKIPAPAAPAPAPQVTRADVQTIQRLVNEFRAELAALGVRVTAVEEELTALKQSASNVKVTGDARARYHFYPTGSPSSTTGYAASNFRSRITFTGQATPGIKVVTRARFYDSPLTTPYTLATVNFDLAYIDFANVFGLSWRLGGQAYTLGAGVGWSGYGLLYDPSNANVYAGNATVEGLLAKGSIAGFSFELADWRESSAAGFDIVTVRAETGFMAGWTLGLSGLYQHRTEAVAVPVAVAGSTSGALTGTGVANTNDTGYQVDLKGDVFPGVSLGLAYAGFNPNTTASSNAYIGWAAVDLSAMGMSAMSPTLTLWYKNYGSATSGVQIPFHSGASTEAGTYANVDWNFKGWGAALDLTFGSGWSGSFSYESGDQATTGGSSVREYYASVTYALAPKTTVSFNYWKTSLGAADQDNFYRIQLNYSY